MRALVLLLSVTAMAQVIDGVKYVWRPGFLISPNVSITRLNDQALLQQFTKNTADDFYTAGNVEGIDKTDITTYGAGISWNTVLLNQWFNSLTVSYDILQPKYGEKMEIFSETDDASKHPVVNTDEAASSMYIRVEDVILHASHNWSNVLPYAGIGFDFYKIGGHLAYTEGAKRSTQITYLPFGALMQISPSLSAKVQANIPLSGKSSYYKQNYQLVDDNYRFSYPEQPTTESEHDLKSGMGYQVALQLRSSILGSGFLVEPYFQIWNLDDKSLATYARRIRRFGLRAKLAF